MDEPKEDINTGQSKIVLNPFAVRKPKKRSLVERELETNMTARITSPATVADGVSTSRYGRARRIKTRDDIYDTLKSPKSENTPVKIQSSIPKAVNSYKKGTPKKALEISSDNNGNTFHDDKSLSCFNNPQLLPKSPSVKSKVYIRKDLIQNRDDDDEDDVILIKDLFSPKSGKKKKMLSTDKLNSSYTKQNGHIVNASVVKALDFDSKNRDSGSKRTDFGDKKKASDISGSRNASDGGKKANVSNKRNSSGNRKASESNKKDSIDNKIGSESNKRISLDNKISSDINKKASGSDRTDTVYIKTDPDSNKKDSVGNKGDHDSNNSNTDCNKADSESNKNNSDGNKKREITETCSTFKKELSDVESTYLYQVGDLAWARMGTFPFWPCIITRDPESEMFVRKKLFGRVEHYILHVTFFADNGRRSWVVDNMLRKYMGLEEFLSAREKFTPEAKKRDPRLYSAFFISEKKQGLWNTSVEEAETLNREPRALRIDIFNGMLYQARASKRQQKSGKVTRTDSDVSLSESLLDTLFCEDASKTDDSIRLRNKSKNRSLDVSDVVTACLDNMAAKTGNIKIQRQSHMDRWLQKAKSKTPEKVKNKVEQALPVTPVIIPKQEVITPVKVNQADKVTPNVEKVVLKVEKPVSNNKKRKHPPKEIKITKVYSLRRSYESQNALIVESENKITESNVDSKDKDKTVKNIEKMNSNNFPNKNPATKDSLDTKSEQLKTKTIKYTKEDGDLKAIDELLEGSSTADNNNLPYKALGEGSKKKRAKKLTDQNQHIKPEVMDVDQSQENITQDTITEILDSPVKTEKESGVDDKLVNESQVEFNCNRIIERFSIETESTTEICIKTPDDNKLKSKRSDLLNECCLRTSDDHETSNALNETSLQTSPTLKPNEMVSIPENLNMTDDESNSMTSIMSAKAKSDMTDLSEKELDKNIADVKSIEKQDIFIENPNVTIEKPVVCQMESTDLPNKNVESVLNSKNETLEVNSSAISDDNTGLSRNESNPFFGNSQSIVDYKDTIDKKVFFREVNINKPPDLKTESVAARADHNNDSEYEDSEDEPSPEYEPLGDEITEDFRQHMKCIETSITDKKDEAQLVRVCNEIVMIEESKFTLSDIKTDMNKICPNSSMADGNVSLLEAQRIVKEERIKSESLGKTINGEIKSEKIVYEETTQIDLTKTLDEDLSKDIKAEILDGLNIINKAVENHLKSSPDKKKHKLSLKRDKSNIEKNIKTENITINDTPINPRYKTIDQIEEIMKIKPKRLPIENGEVSIPEIKENGHHRENDTPDRCDDDFDIDEASVNSEDSEISLHQEKIPARRSLRARPCRKSGLEDPEFLAYMELRQDDLMEQYPDLSSDDIVLYLYKTFAYTQSLKSDVILDESPTLKTVKQETPPSKKKSKKAQPKNTIENFFREKYNNAKKNDFESERSESTYTSDSNDYIKHKRHISISPVDSGIGNSNESDSSVQRKTKSKLPQNNFTEDLTKDVKVELMNDIEHEVSPKTPKRLHKKTFSRRVLEVATSKISPEALENSIDRRIPVVVISPIKQERIETYQHDTRIKLKLDAETIDKYTKKEQIMDTKPALDLGIREPIIDSEIPRPIIDTIPVPVAAKREMEDVPISHVAITQTKYVKITKVKHEPIIETKNEPEMEEKEQPTIETKRELIIETKQEIDVETESLDSDSELPLRQLRTKVLQENKLNELKKEILELKHEIEDTTSISSDNEPLLKLRPKKVDKSIEGSCEDPDFLKYVELKQDNIIDENPQLSQNEIKAYLFKTWIYEKDSKSDMQKNDDIQSYLVKGLNQESAPTRKKRKTKTEKLIDTEEFIAKDKPKRKTVSHYYNEAFISDIEDELEVFEIFKTKKAPLTVVSKPASPKKEAITESKTDEELNTTEEVCEEINTLDESELYFKQLTSPKPSVFKGLIREKVCEVCEDILNLIKCKGCSGMFHYDCVNKTIKIIETPTACKGRKKKTKKIRKPRNIDDSDHSDDRDISGENISMEETTPESITIDAATIEAQIEAKMKEILEKETQINYDSYSSDDGIDWTDTVPGKCELIDVKLKRRAPPIDYTNFRCNNCQKHDTPICFVCKSAVSKTGVKIRQKCNVLHCNSYYHLECLNHWPQTQFNAGEWTRSKKSEQFEALTCPRHVCHTCVSDDPRGCKTRFSGDKLAKCVRCPATYHSFNKCLPAGTQILTASFIICPRHYEHRPGKVPCHVNTAWCFICALGGSLICCEYCPTSFHAECLNIKPPEGNYMCEDCETGRLPLYGEIVWVKLGHYRWWPGVILHPSEIPDNIMAVKHGLGEFVVRFFGQYDHYWVNRGRVFPYQEGDSGRISSQKSKIDVAFTTAMKHTQRAFEILKNAKPDEEESQDIASSLLPPHYVKLKCNKPIGSLLGRKVEDPSLSLTQCECSPAEAEPCGPNSQCINRLLLTECGPTCRAGDRCNNRAFEKRLYPRLTPYRASHRGWGLKTLEDIKAGQFVIEYVGELIDEEEFQRRMRRQHEIRDENFYFLTLDKERMIDAGPKGNLARFMNHCCEPNCETQKWTVLGDVRVGLFAIDDIKANSEVTFNYNLECSGIEKKRCLCGAKRCSGYIGAKPKQLDESRKKNGMAKRKYTKRKNIESPSAKSKVKKPVGRPPKPKELTEIEKDLLIIKSATISDESSSQSKIDSITSGEASIPTGSTIKLENTSKESSKENQMSKESKIDSKIKEEMPVLNNTERIEANMLKRKLDLKSEAVGRILNEPSAKRYKCDKIDVGG